VAAGSREENASKQKMRALVLIQSELIWLWRVFRFARIIAGSPVASWFETREDALLTMRV
jgi:hypothetical protein